MGVVYERGGERTGKGVVKACVKHSIMKEREREEGGEDIVTIRRLKRRKGIVVLGMFRIDSSCTLLPISKEQRC